MRGSLIVGSFLVDVGCSRARGAAGAMTPRRHPCGQRDIDPIVRADHRRPSPHRARLRRRTDPELAASDGAGPGCSDSNGADIWHLAPICAPEQIRETRIIRGSKGFMDIHVEPLGRCGTRLAVLLCPGRAREWPDSVAAVGIGRRRRSPRRQGYPWPLRGAGRVDPSRGGRPGRDLEDRGMKRKRGKGEQLAELGWAVVVNALALLAAVVWAPLIRMLT